MKKGFRRSALVGALAGALMITGCNPPSTASKGSSSGSLALSNDDAFLYAADTDNGIVAVIDTRNNQVVEKVKVGERPARVAVDHQDNVYVTNRGSKTVSVIRRGVWEEAAKIEVGHEPVGLTVSPDGKTLMVVSATSNVAAEYGTLTAIDLKTLTPKWEVNVGAEPRGVAMTSNDKALVTLYKTGEIIEVDANKGQVLNEKGIGVHSTANASRVATGPTPGVSSFQPRAVGDIVVTPDGTRAFAPVVWAREDNIGRRPSSAGGYYSSGGPCNVGAVASAGILTVETGGTGPSTPLADDLTACASSGVNQPNKDFPVSVLSGRGTSGSEAIQGPVAAAVDPTGNWLYVVNRESSNVAVLPAFRRTGGDLTFGSSGSSVRSLVPVGEVGRNAGADGIALTRDGTKAYVYSQFDHRVEMLASNGKGESAEVVNQGSSKYIQVAGDTLSPELAEGRRLFFDATNLRMSSNTTRVACSTCHLEGTEDGHVWMFPDGPRQTPSLAGRKLFGTAPYHWSGEFGTLQAFMDHTVRERMGGSGVTETMANRIAAFVDGMPQQANPYRKPELTEAQVRGGAIFVKAECNTCHAGQNLSDGKNHDVGTLVLRSTTGRAADNGIVTTQGLNTPSLISIARTAPYLHDGSTRSLLERISNDNGGKHGKTAALTAAEKADLVEYLKAL